MQWNRKYLEIFTILETIKCCFYTLQWNTIYYWIMMSDRVCLLKLVINVMFEWAYFSGIYENLFGKTNYMHLYTSVKCASWISPLSSVILFLLCLVDSCLFFLYMLLVQTHEWNAGTRQHWPIHAGHVYTGQATCGRYELVVKSLQLATMRSQSAETSAEED